MKELIKKIVLSIGILMIVTYCESPVDSGSDDFCYYIGEDGQVHRYVCGSNYGGGGYDYKRPFRIAISLPDTALNCAYGVFFIKDTTTYEYDYAIRGKCGNGTVFSVYSDVSYCSYLAVLVSKTQENPINFEPATGDYLGWYGGNGIYPGINCSYEYPNIYSVYLKEVL